MHLVFRAATLADAEDVAEVYLASRKHFLPYAPLAHSDDGVREYVRGYLIPRTQVTVAQVGGRIVGLLALTDGTGNEEHCPDVLYEWSGKISDL